MKIQCITGQTATGKTSYALNLAKQLNGELINCDSRQIYKHLDIITGKDLTDKTFHTVQQKNNFQIGYYELQTDDKPVKIWLYDIVQPTDYFSSFDYQNCALETIKDIIQRNKTPIIVGGTYFYLKHLLYSIKTENIKPQWELRTMLSNKTVDELQTILKNKSTEYFDRLNQSEKHNPQRLIRKIEMFEEGNEDQQTMTNTISLPEKLKVIGMSDTIEINITGLRYETKERLHTIINSRVEQRVKAGAFQEVEQLLKKGYKPNDPGLKTIGYQQIIQYLEKKCTKDEAIETWITKEKQYAKRQETFMKKDQNITWEIL